MTSVVECGTALAQSVQEVLATYTLTAHTQRSYWTLHCNYPLLCSLGTVFAIDGVHKGTEHGFVVFLLSKDNHVHTDLLLLQPLGQSLKLKT